MKFLEKVVSDLLTQNIDLSQFKIVLPGKRPVVFIKKILRERHYSGVLPDFITIENFLTEVSGCQPVSGIALWLFAYEQYASVHPEEDFSGFVKWFPTILKDWDDMLKFSTSDTAILSYMLDEERIKNWSENLGVSDDIPRRKYMNFWQKVGRFLPLLKKKLAEKQWSTSGMIHEEARRCAPEFIQKASGGYVFCGFNAFTPVEEILVRGLLQLGKAQCFFEADHYYIDDERQEAGRFLRDIQSWKEFNEHRPFKWIKDDFAQPKDIRVYEVSGNVTQAKVLPEILSQLNDQDYSHTAVVLLDENLLPSCLDALGGVSYLNITMGFPLKNLSFSNAVRQLFYVQKQLEKNDRSYYYSDVLAMLDEMPNSPEDQAVIRTFKSAVEQRNIVYISRAQLAELLGSLSYFHLLEKFSDAETFLDGLIEFCYELKFRETDDILYENISHFEKSFKIIRNQLKPYAFPMRIETMEVLVNQLVNSEVIDFQGEPLRGLQVMGMLETRLLDFENVIILSANEGKLPVGNTQNSYLPFDVRKNFHLHTFEEGDSIAAYHFYRLLQGSQNIHILFNALNSGVNTGEKSRFITQLEIEDPHHELQHIIIENSSEPIAKPLIEIEKTTAVTEKLELWKQKVSASHLTTFIYNPIDFYLTKILGTRETGEVEEELSQRSYGNLVHLALQIIYEKLVGKTLVAGMLDFNSAAISQIVNEAIAKLNHEQDFYRKGMNYIHRSIAERVVGMVVAHDHELLKNGHRLEILGIEEKFEGVRFPINEEATEVVNFYGFIDRVDRLDGTLRIIDYKTARTKNLMIAEPKNSEDAARIEDLFFRDDMKQAMQLSIYAYAALYGPKKMAANLECGIWSFAEASRGMQQLQIFGQQNITPELLQTPMSAVRKVIAEILNSETKFVEQARAIW